MEFNIYSAGSKGSKFLGRATSKNPALLAQDWTDGCATHVLGAPDGFVIEETGNGDSFYVVAEWFGWAGFDDETGKVYNLHHDEPVLFAMPVR